jgi:glutamine amidotransferase
MQKIILVDYGVGNLRSIANAIHYLGYETVISSDPRKIILADQVILPGVGSYQKAMESLSNLSLDKAIREYVLYKKKKILGICLGMQLIGKSSTEGGHTSGLGILDFEVDELVPSKSCKFKVPHVGFNQVIAPSNSTLFKGISVNSDFYFIHSYKVKAPIKEAICGKSGDENDFISFFEYENIFATQFHPEKSQTNGLILLNNFLKI